MAGDPYLIQGPALISFSGGRTSGYMLKHIIDAHGGALPDSAHVVFANTGREMPETLDFVQECADRWNVRIVWLEYDPEAEHKTTIVSHNSASRNGEPFAALIKTKGYLPNPLTRFCSIEMKIRRCKEYMHSIMSYETWTTALGLRADEMRRVKKIGNARERWTNIAPLATAGVTKRDVVAWWAEQPFDLRLPNVNGKTALGNCDLCFLKSEATLRGIIHQRPDLAGWWVSIEERLTAAAKELAATLTVHDAPTEVPAISGADMDDWPENQDIPMRDTTHAERLEWLQSARRKMIDGARFRLGRPSYAEMLRDAGRQADLIDFLNDGGSVDCACHD